VSLSSVSIWTRDILKPVLAPVSTVPMISWEPPQLCNGCGRILLVSDFHIGQSRCKDCRREYMRQRGDLHRQQTRRARDKRRAVAREYVIQLLLSGSCADCGLADPAVLEFDHVGPKLMEVGEMVREAYRLERIKREIANCELVCANCHRRRTSQRIRSWRVDPDWRSSQSTRPSRSRNLLSSLSTFGGLHASIADSGTPWFWISTT
jgi:DNA-directed RNA polymerase subunit M/transcription elongation factor TFIIS